MAAEHLNTSFGPGGLILSSEGKGLWLELENMDCDEVQKNRSSAILGQALGDNTLRVCFSHIGNPIKMPEKIKNRLVSNCVATRISMLASLSTKCLNWKKDHMFTFIDEFESSPSNERWDPPPEYQIHTKYLCIWQVWAHCLNRKAPSPL